MSLYAACEALTITGITPEEKLLLLIMTGRGLDTDGCFPKRAFPTLLEQSLLTPVRFDRAIARLYRRGLFLDCVSDGEDSVRVIDWSVQNLTGVPQ